VSACKCIQPCNCKVPALDPRPVTAQVASLVAALEAGNLASKPKTMSLAESLTKIKVDLINSKRDSVVNVALDAIEEKLRKRAASGHAEMDVMQVLRDRDWIGVMPTWNNFKPYSPVPVVAAKLRELGFREGVNMSFHGLGTVLRADSDDIYVLRVTW
jgi:hypothetical protein